METNQTQNPQSFAGNYSMPSQIKEVSETMASMTKLLTNIGDTLLAIRREFRGEVLYQDDNGNSSWIQISKPSFIVVDFKTGKPVMEKKKMPWGEEKMCYVANDIAIDTLLRSIKFMGVNPIQPLGFNTEGNYQDDLREFECKLSAVLALKQKEWGIDKEELPIIMTEIKTLVQDVRSMSVKGQTLKALQTTVQRVEQMIEGEKTKSKLSPY